MAQDKQGDPVRVLLVEDEEVSRDDTLAVLAALDANGYVDVVQSRNEAFEFIKSGEYDLIVCDLKIPPDSGSLGADEAHGMDVHAFAREQCPGTPLIFLTGRATDRNLRSQLSSGGIADYYGMRGQPLVQLAIKDIGGEEIPLIRQMVDGLCSLGNCVVVCESELDAMLVRAAQMYGKRIDAKRVTFDPYTGFSGARVGRATFELTNGQSRLVLVKLESRVQALTEQKRYEENVPTKLDHGYYVPLVAPALHGLRKSAALYYAFAKDSISFFSLCKQDPATAAEVVATMSRFHRRWTDEFWHEHASLKDLRRRRVVNGDVRAARLWDTTWCQQVEEVELDLEMCTGHGDLHGDNVLVNTSGHPTLIDFGDVGPYTAAFDPVTLELSLLFYERGPGVDAPWCTVERLSRWSDLDAFTEGLALSPVIRACRQWANAVASEDTVRATAYAHAARQLKFCHVDPEKAVAVARSAADAWVRDS